MRKILLFAALACCFSCTRAVQRLPAVWHASTLDYIHQTRGIRPIFRAADSLKYARCYAEALKSFSAIAEKKDADIEEQCYAYNQISYLYLLLRQDSMAQVWSDRFQALTPHPESLSAGARADGHLNAGWAAMRHFKPKTARYHLEKAIALYDSLYAGGPHIKRALAYTQLSMTAYHFEEENRGFYNYAKKAYMLIRQDSVLQAHSIETEMNMMYACIWKRKYEAARAHINNVIYLAAHLPQPDTLALARAYSMQGRMARYFAAVNKTPMNDAIEKIQYSIALGKNLAGRDQIELKRHLALCFLDNKDSASVAAIVSDLEKMEQKWGACYAFPNRIMGHYYLRTRQIDKSIAAFLAHLKRHENDTAMSIQIRSEPYVYLAEMYGALPKPAFDSAIHYLGKLFLWDAPSQKRLITAEDIVNPNVYGQEDFPFWILNRLGNILLNRYKVEKKEKHLLQAFHAFQLSDRLLFDNNPAYDDDIIFNFQEEVGATLYAGAVETLYLLDSLHPRQPRYRSLAMHYIDRMKSDVLFRFLPENLPIDSIRRIKADIEALQSQKEIPPAGYFSLAYNLFRLEQLTFHGGRKKDLTFDAETAQKELSPQQAVLQYKAAGKQLFILYMDRQTILLRRQMFADAQTLHFWADSLSKARIKNHIAADRALSHTLYQALAAPFKKELARRPDWIIIPDGKIFQTPFEALSPRPHEKDSLYFLVNEDTTRSFTYAPAWKIWRTARAPRPANERGQACFFNYGKNKEGLICSDMEFAALSRYNAQAKPFEYERCTKEIFKNVWETEGSNVIHLSLHGKANTQSLSGNKIWFGEARQDAMYDFEIARLRGDADLVVLSACETGTGALQSGEGAHSMARSFFQAGARSVIAALWEIDNCANAQQIEYMYRELKRFPPAQALSRAKRLYLRNQKGLGKYPANWSGLIYLQ